MIIKIIIEADLDTGKVSLDAPLSNQEQKDTTGRILNTACNLAINYQPEHILKPKIDPKKIITPPKPSLIH